MKKVVIVERVKTIREGIKIFINRFSEFECLASFSNLNDFNDNAKTLKPNILLIDTTLPKINIKEEIKSIRSDFPDLTIIALILNEENDLLFDLLLSGANSYIHKNVPPPKLVKTIKEASEGKMSVNSLLARKTLKYINQNGISANYYDQELMLLNKIIEGNNITAIQKSLNMSLDDIKISFFRIYEKIFQPDNYLSKRRVD